MLQWFVPSVVLMVVVVILVLNFSSRSSGEATERVYKDMIEKTEAYGEDFYAELTQMQTVAAPVVELLEQEGVSDDQYVQRLLQVAVDCSKAGQVIYCNGSGEGIDQNGEAVAIGETDYFQACFEQTDFRFVYAKADEVLLQDSIMITTKVNGEQEQGYLLLFYPMKNFREILDAVDVDSEGYLLLLDSEGTVLGVSGTGKSVSVGDNMIDKISRTDTEAAKTIKNRIKNGTRGTTEAKIGETTRVLSYVPFGVNHWEMMMGASRSFADRQIEQQWSNTKQMLVQLLVVFFVFVCAIMVINIIARISSNEKKKQLEDKADTDQLTGLNNKLATERKIKEYMEKHPDSQSMMFLLDIDNFKKINDTMGHAFGDEVLRSLGQQIGSNFRASDIIGRIGGDEFMIFLKGIEDPEAIRKEARKIETFFKGFQAGEYVKYAATASIGVAIFPQEGADFETLYKAADQGLYKAKERGKNQLAFYRDEWAEKKS